MAANPKDLLRSPKYKLPLEALRSLVPVTYVRTNEPEALMASYDAIMRWRVFATTVPDRVNPVSPLLTSKGDSPEKLTKRQIPRASRVRGFGPEDAVEHMLTSDPHNEQGLGVIEVFGPNTIEHLGGKIQAFIEKRFADIRWVSSLVFVGTLPAKEAVPKSLWDFFYPIDTVEGAKTEGVDTRTRVNVPSPEETLREFKKNCEDLGFSHRDVKNLVAPPILEGMTLFEIHTSMYMSYVAQRKTYPRETPPDTLLIHPQTIDAYKNRWARIP
jgi:hypothetical protein